MWERRRNAPPWSARLEEPLPSWRRRTAIEVSRRGDLRCCGKHPWLRAVITSPAIPLAAAGRSGLSCPHRISSSTRRLACACRESDHHVEVGCFHWPRSHCQQSLSLSSASGVVSLANSHAGIVWPSKFSIVNTGVRRLPISRWYIYICGKGCHTTDFRSPLYLFHSFCCTIRYQHYVFCEFLEDNVANTSVIHIPQKY